MMAMLRHCDNNAAKRDFGIKNDYISNERVYMYIYSILIFVEL